MLFLPFKIFKLFLILCILGVLIFLLTNFITPSDDLKKADVIIAISGGETASRTQHAIDLYKEGWAPKLIFSGDALDPLSPSNADVMKQIATLSSVPSKDVFIEEQSDNTQENAELSQNIIESLGYGTVILVTADYHQRRAYIEFRGTLGEDIEIINSPIVEEQWDKNWWWAKPNSWRLTVSETFKIPISYVRTSL